MKLKSIFIFISLLFTGLAMAETTSPQVTVKNTISKVVTTFESTSFPSVDARKDAVLKIVGEVFDFEEMAKRSLGSTWSKYSVEDQNNFVTAFADFLAKTYLNRIENVSEEMVSVDSEQVREDKALVKTKVKLKDSQFPIDYKMHLENGAWLVYDVVIENVGLVANYRNEFASILRTQDLATLTQKLLTKTATLK